MWIILLFAGLFLGGYFFGDEAALVGAAFGSLLGLHLGVLRRLSRTDKSLAALRERLESFTGAAPEADGVEKPAAPAGPPPQSAYVQASETTAAAPESGPVPPPRPAPTAPGSDTGPSTPPGDGGSGDEWTLSPGTVYGEPRDRENVAVAAVKRFFTGGNLAVRLGVVVLFFGVAFLLKYAAEHSRLPMELRLAGIALGGIVMLGLGWTLRRRREAYSLALQGGGIGVIYLTVFAGFRLYQLVPGTLTFAILVAVAMLSAAVAVMQNAASLAVLSVSGGFLAPVLTSTGGGSHVALFTYYAILNGAILGIAWFKSWRILNLVGFGFTFVIGAAWGYQAYRPEHFATTEPFLILFFLFYVMIAVLFAFRQAPKLRGYVDGTLVFGVPLVAFGLQHAMVRTWTYGSAGSALALAAFYLLLSWGLIHRAGSGLRTLAEAFLAMGVAFATLAVPLALDARWTAATWALEGAAVLWIGVRQDRLLPRLSGALLQLGGGVAFMMDVQAGSVLILNGRFMSTALLAAAGGFSAWYLHRHREALRPFERPVAPVLLVAGVLWWFGGGLVEVADNMPDRVVWGALLIFLALSCAGSEFARVRIDWPQARYPALGLLPGMVAVGVLMADTEPHPFAKLGWLGWACGIAAHYWILHRQEPVAHPYQRLLHAAAVWLTVIVLSAELAWEVDRIVAGAGTWGAISWGLVPAALLLLLVGAVRRVAWPFWSHGSLYLGLGAWPVAGYLWVWVLAVNATSTGDPWPLPFVPVFNPLDLAVGFACLAMFAWWGGFREVNGYSPLARLTPLAAGLMVSGTLFAWVNAMLLRALHHWAAIPFLWDAMFRSNLVQASLAVLWGLTGLAGMVIGARLARRPLWLIGAGLMGIVVLKIFVVDLSSTGTIERIVSFITVGVLLMVVGYLAPVPPRRNTEDLSE